jgi:glycosyltransferase involved in cell wall biosynthesis
VLVLAAFPATSGPGLKYRAWARAFAELGCSCELRAEVAGADELSRTIAAEPWDLIFLRADERSAGVLPALQTARAAGARVVAEVPTPHRNVAREIARSSLTPRLKARYEWRLVLAARLWREADVIVDTAPDGWPWRRIARRRRLIVSNGVELERLVLAPGWKQRATLHLVTAASAAHWHGYQRLVRGLPGAPQATVTLIGDRASYGPVLALADELGVADRVEAPGERTGAALAEALARADVGVSSVALHRIGGGPLSPLKTREYLGSGLPVLVAGDDPDLRDDPPFVFRAPSDDRPLDLLAVGAWLAELRRSSVDAAAIRALAAERFDYRPRARAVLEAAGVAAPED